MTLSHYHDPSDAQYTRVFKEQTPDVLATWGAFNNAVFATEGRELPLKMRELMAVAVGLATQCVYCIEFHTKQAMKAGATEAELAETVWVTSALRAGGSFTHGRMAFKFAEAGTEAAGA
jgi:AhpD family alkylhydroperoxidase